ncbi:MAG TPA: hypothetical protein VEZ17_11220, partial [Chitinophagaceae bacterium]|nr:hypothetical protein [Chitinophagaceae bacterium]
MNQIVVFSRLLFVVMYFLPLLSHAQAGTMNDPFVIRFLLFSDSRSNTDFGNTYSRPESPYFGQPSPDIFYRFTIRVPGELNVSTCGSNFNTYIHLLAEDGTPLQHNDDNGVSCAGTTASMLVNLTPGTYYIVMEGSGSATGLITSSVRFLGRLFPIDTNLPVGPEEPVVSDALNFTRVWEVLSPQRDAGL